MSWRQLSERAFLLLQSDIFSTLVAKARNLFAKCALPQVASYCAMPHSTSSDKLQISPDGSTAPQFSSTA
jgi:hypothetical protein